ncbi:MAG: NUDIX domain-containing protein [Ignavibacteriales bacterium]|nr:NUDIX domain-containing protein [Ignavibacteriales bacterium]
MLHRVKKENDYHEGKWNGLGGKFEQGESPEECAVREIEEECGLKVKVSNNERIYNLSFV